MRGCTIVAKNYLPFARVLARSWSEHHPAAPFTVLVLDDLAGYADAEAEPFAVLRPADLDLPGFREMARDYEVLELSTAVKPWLLRRLLAGADGEPVLYLDPDIRIYRPLDELGAAASGPGIALIPHLTQPIPRDGRFPAEIDIMLAGVYNLGFLGLAPGAAAEALLDWWSERLATDCRVDPARGYFVDQRWMDLAPPMFGAAVVRDPGYDVAYWNLHYRRLDRGDEGYLVNGRPLRFFHFSGYDPRLPAGLSRHQNRISLGRRPDLRALCDAYGRELLAAGHEECRAWPYEPLGAARRRPARRAAAPAPEAIPEIPLPSSEEPPRRSLGERIVDLEKLVRGERLQGASRAAVAWRVAESVNPLRRASPGAPAARGAKPERRAGGVNVVGYLNGELGVGEAARQAVRALGAAEVPVEPVGTAADASRNRHAHPVVPPEQAPYATNLVCVNADMLAGVRRSLGPAFFHGRTTIGLWFWEVLAFPAAQLDSFALVDEVWVCSEHVARALRGRSAKPVTQVRLPVAPGAVAPGDRRALGLPEGFVFLFLFDHQSVFERKNPLGLLQAFRDAFGDGDEASLVIKTINARRRPREHEALLAAARDDPRIRIVDGYVEAAVKNAMLASCDCYVSLHRSEGFGLTLAEAMYFGRPVIATGYSGNLDFMTADNSHLVDYELVPVGPGAEPYPGDAEWAEPDLDQAARLMRAVFEDPGAAAALGERGAADVRRTHSPRAAGEVMRRRLEEIWGAGPASSGPRSARTPAPR